MSEHREPSSETSPLISNAIRNVEPGDGLGSEGGAAVIGNGTFKSNGQSDAENQHANDDHAKHQGLPEVKKKMKYIFPAVAIGVFLSAADQTIIVSRYVCKAWLPFSWKTLTCAVVMVESAPNSMLLVGRAGSQQHTFSH